MLFLFTKAMQSEPKLKEVEDGTKYLNSPNEGAYPSKR